jgi:group I intron endonuclease
MIIYKSVNTTNGKIYIGKTVNLERRISEHLKENNTYFQHALRKYGQNSFVFEPIAWCETKEHANFLERFYIKIFNSKIPNGYNITDGGDGYGPGKRKGTKSSLDVCKKISKALKGKGNPRFGDHRNWKELFGPEKAKQLKETYSEQFSGEKNPMYGRSQSEYCIEQTRKANVGRPCSEYCKEQSRRLNTGKKRPDVSQRMRENNPMKYPDVIEKRSGGNHPMKYPEIAAKVSKALTGCKHPYMVGELNPMKRPEVVVKISGENNPSKRPEVKEKQKSYWTPVRRKERSELIKGRKHPNAECREVQK